MVEDKVFEAGRKVYTDHPVPPAERDIFSLAGAPFDDLVAAFNTVPNFDESAPNYKENLDRAYKIGELIVASSVGLIRAGTPAEIAHAASNVAGIIAQKNPEDDNKSYVGGCSYPVPLLLAKSAAEVLSAANYGSHRFEVNLLSKRSDGQWPNAIKVLSVIDDVAGNDRSKAIKLKAIVDAADISAEDLVHDLPFAAANHGAIDDLYRQGLINDTRVDHARDIRFFVTDLVDDNSIARSLLKAYRAEQLEQDS